ncbi:MAG: sulfurtransferase [Vampirovibrionales bacterium]
MSILTTRNPVLQTLSSAFPVGFTQGYPLVEKESVQQALTHKHIQLWDVRYVLPNSHETAYERYLKAHIPNSQFVCLDTDLSVADPQGRPHMMPDAETFALCLARIGYEPEKPLILIDEGEGLRSTARVWWMMQSVGLTNVWLLNGGLNHWKSTYEVASSLPSSQKHTTASLEVQEKSRTILNQMDTTLHAHYWCTKEEVKHRDLNTCAVLDARMPERFYGTVPEPRAGLRAGHIEGSCNVPFHQVYDQETGQFLSKKALEALLSPYTNEATTIITSCGSGVTACSLAVALRLLDIKRLNNIVVYDGSWAEYGLVTEAL